MKNKITLFVGSFLGPIIAIILLSLQTKNKLILTFWGDPQMFVPYTHHRIEESWMAIGTLTGYIAIFWTIISCALVIFVVSQLLDQVKTKQSENILIYNGFIIIGCIVGFMINYFSPRGISVGVISLIMIGFSLIAYFNVFPVEKRTKEAL